MIWLIALTLMSLLLLMIEVLLPGFGIFGISGSIALILSFTLTSMQYGFSVFLIQLIVSIVFIAFLIHIAKSKKEKLILHDTLTSKDFDETTLQGLEGKQGVTVTTLQPYGTIEVEEKQIDVFSNEGYIEKNTVVQIMQIKGKTVIVKSLKEDSYDIY